MRRRLRGGSEHPPRRVLARNSAWLHPAAGAVLGAGLAVLFVVNPFGTHHWLPRGLAWRISVAQARTGLGSVLGVVLTSLSIALSLSLVVLQTTASQYSPRLLRLFMHSLGFRLLVPTFVATGVYCLVGMCAFGFVDDPGVAPQPALSIAMLLLVCCGAALVFQMTYMLGLVRVEQVVHQTKAHTLKVAHALDRRHRLDAEQPPTAPAPSGTWRPVTSHSSGFVVDIDARALLRLAEAHELVIHVDVIIGEPIVRGTQLGRVLSERGPLEEDSTKAVERTVLIGPWREPDRDLSLGVRQLVDVAIKALSPGINDPSSAVEALDALTVLLCELCTLRQGSRVLADPEGRPRVFLRELELRDYLVLATEQISRYGAGEPAVVLRLLRLAGEVGLRAGRAPDQRAIREVLHQVRADAESALGDSSRLPLLRRYAEEVERALEHAEPLPPLPSLGF
ncbi:hypothetical protein MEBOL_000843 [Melittangium boletus DSM 14713]|uniref:DUF2254 domain-containing protein n=2 Tax=Melittangium boletus TaxID=83453 RepID=A0A250I879_9BACT|nr:hypothetical protein MEBOL_000843 [Melittangium boletus DSM 14713]